MRHLLALEALGWHVVALRPSSTDESAFWRISIRRHDQNMTITIPEAEDPDVALEELVQYANVDAA